MGELYEQKWPSGDIACTVWYHTNDDGGNLVFSTESNPEGDRSKAQNRYNNAMQMYLDVRYGGYVHANKAIPQAHEQLLFRLARDHNALPVWQKIAVEDPRTGQVYTVERNGSELVFAFVTNLWDKDLPHEYRDHALKKPTCNSSRDMWDLARKTVCSRPELINVILLIAFNNCKYDQKDIDAALEVYEKEHAERKAKSKERNKQQGKAVGSIFEMIGSEVNKK